nr:putative replication associated protein [Crucivirus sp.]
MISRGIYPREYSSMAAVETKESLVTPLGMGEQREIILSETEAIDDKSRKKNWVFTWNNYTVEDLKTVNEQWLKLPNMRCVVYEPEIGKQGTPHLQGFFIFDTLKSFKQVKEMIDKRVWFAQMRKPIDANLKYCSKEGGTIYLGDVPKTQKEKGYAGKEYVSKYGHVWSHLIDDIKNGMTFKTAAEKYPDCHGMYPRGFKEKFDLFAPKPVFNLPERVEKLYDWQKECIRILGGDPDDRSVYWVWSKDGNTGKSDMLKHLVSVNGFQPMQNAPTRDLACAWKGGDVVFDYSRDEQAGGQINYAVLEHIKNRLLFSPKYESQTKMSEDFKSIHVVCFSNSPPDVSKLSQDRWNVYRIENIENKPWLKQTVYENALF